MDPAAFVSERNRLAWGLATVAAIVGGLCASFVVDHLAGADRTARLRIEAGRAAVEIISQTLNGNVMGTLALLSVIDDGLRRDALGLAPPNGPQILSRLELAARLYGAEGVFVVGRNGIVASSWDAAGRPSTGLDVRFRPYFAMAMKGKENVYAAVSLARGDRALYFANPILIDESGTEPIGAVVARTSLDRIDRLLTAHADAALLLSPQGVVFAGSRKEWVGNLSGAATPERLKAIRDLRQFGSLFDTGEPRALPFAVTDGVVEVDGRRHALARADMEWNDPSGRWTLVLLEDLSRTVPMTNGVLAGLAVAAILLLFAMMVRGLLRGHHARAVALRRIEDYARAQDASASRKSRIATAARLFQRAKSVAELARLFLGEAHAILGSLQGAVYVRDGDRFRLAAGFACSDPAAEVVAGEGLLGQCVEDREVRVLDLADAAFTVRSGLGAAPSAAVLMAPLVLDERALGVVELAFLAAPDAIVHEQFVEMTALLALNLEVLRSHSPTPTDAVAVAP